MDAEARRFDVIIVEALDRLSRKVAEKTKRGQLGRARVLTASQINSYGPLLGTKERPVKRRELQNIGVRLPADVDEWISARAERNQSSINAEIIRCVRDAMDHLARLNRQVPCTTPPHDRPGAAS